MLIMSSIIFPPGQILTVEIDKDVFFLYIVHT